MHCSTPSEQEPTPRDDAPKGRTAEEVGRFFAAINRRSESGTRFYALAMLLSYTGLRVGEALALHDADLDLVAGAAAVRSGKTHASERTALLPGGDKQQELTDAVAAWRKVRATWNPTCPLLFVGRPRNSDTASEPLLYQSVQRTFREVSDRAGLDRPITPHQLRHTYASVLIGNGAPITGVSKQLGHANPRITMSTYAWCVAREQRDAVSCF